MKTRSSDLDSVLPKLRFAAVIRRDTSAYIGPRVGLDAVDLLPGSHETSDVRLRNELVSKWKPKGVGPWRLSVAIPSGIVGDWIRPSRPRC